MDIKKAVSGYHRNLAIVIGALLAVFVLLPVVIQTPYIINIFIKFITNSIIIFFPFIEIFW